MTLRLVVGRIGRPHGIRGDVVVDVRTDSPAERFAAGSVLDADRPEIGTLTVEGTQWHSGRLLVRFAGVTDRTAAQALGGVLLEVDGADLPPPADPDEFHDHQLVGLAAIGPAGTALGEVVEVVHTPSGELLVLRTGEGREVLVPFVRDIVPEVDVPGGRLVVDPPEGLLDL